MPEHDSRKPLIPGNPETLKEFWAKQGYAVEFVGDPTYFTDIRVQHTRIGDTLSALETESSELVQSFLEDREADGGLVIRKEVHHVAGLTDSERYSLLVRPYKIRLLEEEDE